MANEDSFTVDLAVDRDACGSTIGSHPFWGVEIDENVASSLSDVLIWYRGKSLECLLIAGRLKLRQHGADENIGRLQYGS